MKEMFLLYHCILLDLIAIFYIYQKRWLKENFEAFAVGNNTEQIYGKRAKGR